MLEQEPDASCSFKTKFYRNKLRAKNINEQSNETIGINDYTCGNISPAPDRTK